MALSIAMATLGIVSFIKSIRDTAPALYRDVYLIRNRKRTIQKSQSMLDTQKLYLEQWAEKWMIWDENEEEALWHIFWGNGSDYTMVKRELNDIHRDCKELEDGIQHFRKRALRYVVYKKPLTDDLLKDLDTRIKGLAVKADSAFRNKREGRRRRDPEDQYIKDIGNRHRLLQLARQTTDNSNALFDSCTLAQTELCLELELNFFNSSLAGSREQAISKSSRDGRLYFNFLTKLRSKPDDLVIRTQIHCAPAHEEDARPPPTVHVAFRRAFEEMVNHRSRSHRFQAPGGHVYSLKESQDPSLRGNENTTQYRALLLREAQAPPNGILFQQRRQDLMKMKLAFEVAECGLFFIQSSWFPLIVCSCALRHMQLSSGESYLLRVETPLHHTTPPLDLCWCRLDPTADPWRGLRLRYLGVLLIEIALRRPIYDVRLQANTELEFKREANGQWESMLQIFALVQTATTGTTVRQVVEFCITNTWTTHEFDLEMYYRHVFLPYASPYQGFEKIYC